MHGVGRRGWRGTIAGLVVALVLGVLTVAAPPPAGAGPLPRFNLAWGSFGSTNGLFSSPRGIAFSPVSDQVYVADSANNRIQVFTRDGAFVRKWGRLGTTNGRFSDPRGIAVDSTGNVYVVDRSNNRVQKFTSTGTFVTAWGTLGGGDGQLRNPRGIAVDANGSVYVADTGNDRIQKFSNTGVFLAKWGATGAGNGQFSIPSDVTFGSNSVYVADSGNDRIQRFSTTGSFLGAFGTTGAGPGQFEAPRGVAFDTASSELLVMDTGNDRLQRLDQNGGFQEQQGSTGAGTGQYSAAEDVAVDVRGNVFVADTTNHRVQRLGFAGAPPPFSRAFGTSGSGPGQFSTLAQIATDSDGNVYTADTGNDRVDKLAPDGFPLLSLPGLTDVLGVAVGGDGTIFALLPGGVSPFGPTGTPLPTWSVPSSLAIAVSPVTGDVFVAEGANDSIRVYSSAGTFLRSFGDTNAACTGGLHSLGGVAVGEDGHVYVSDRSDDCISVFTETGTFLDAFGAAGTGPGTLTSARQVTVGPDGNVTVVDDLTDLVQTFTPAGDLLAGWGTVGVGSAFGNLENPTGVAADPFGNLFVADRDNHRIQRFAHPGTVSGTITGPGTDGFVVALQVGSYGLVQGADADATGNYAMTLPPGQYVLGFLDRTAAHTFEWRTDHADIADVTPADYVVVSPAGTTTADATLASSGLVPPPTPATLNGTVTGTAGGLVGAFVYAVDLVSGRSTGTLAGAGGQYSITGLPPSPSYRVIFIDPTGAHVPEWHLDRPQLQLDTAQDVVLTAGQATVLNATLADNPAF